MNKYTEQAEQFLRDTSTTFAIEYQYTGPHFKGDKEKRDVYRFTLRNARGEYSANFGDSIRNTERRAFAADHANVFDVEHNPNARSLGFKNRVDILAARKAKPTAYDVLACLQKSDVGSFADFCADYGYDEQPLGAYPAVMKTYDAVCAEYAALRSMFTQEQLEQMQDIN